jgi:hypothetical protein
LENALKSLEGGTPDPWKISKEPPKIEGVSKGGRGAYSESHDYIPIEWKFIGSSPEKSKRVTRLLCRTCFSNISVSTILENYPDVS